MKKLHQGGCHCGAVRFECRLDAAEGTSRCNCSVCAKGRFWKAIARKDDFRMLGRAQVFTAGPQNVDSTRWAVGAAYSPALGWRRPSAPCRAARWC